MRYMCLLCLGAGIVNEHVCVRFMCVRYLNDVCFKFNVLFALLNVPECIMWNIILQKSVYLLAIHQNASTFYHAYFGNNVLMFV